MEYIKSEHYDIVRNDYGREKVVPSEKEWAEVKHGRWEVKGQDIYCSQCGNESAYNPFGASKFSLYCPNCGAKMGDDE